MNAENPSPIEPFGTGSIDLYAGDIQSTPNQPILDRPPILRRRRIVLPIVLFFATCFSMFVAQSGLRFGPLARPLAPGIHRTDDVIVVSSGTTGIVLQYWRHALIYTVAGIAVLFSHEMGHFLQAVRYRVPASLPYFIPFPFSMLGTMGAVIGMQGSLADRKQMFDIGLTGPLAGLIVALPICWVGVRDAVPTKINLEQARQQGMVYNDPLLFQLLIRHLHPELPVDAVFEMNPYYMAGWMAMLITGLNMMPISQLDGGHVAYALFGRKAHWLARGIVALAIGYILISQQFFFVVMLLLIVFVIGTDHPPTADDTVPLGWGRRILGLLSLTIPIFCLAPVPILLPG